VFKGAMSEIIAVKMEEIECDVDQAVCRALRKRLLQSAKAAGASLVHRHNLAVDKRILDIQLGQVGGDCRKALRPVYAVAADEPHPLAVDPAKHAVTVELYLVQPLVAVGRRFNEFR